MSEVRYGILLHDFPEDNSRERDHIQNLITYLDSLDDVYESVCLGDHFTLGELEAMDADILECLTALAYLSAKFPNLKFGPLTLASSLRNPALLAKLTATFSVLTESNFILGMGAGWNEEEYRQYGYEFPSGRIRIEQMEEAIQIIKLLWTQNGVTFEGKHHRVENAYCNPKPDPVPPILIGGEAEKYTLRAVAKYADWWNGFYRDRETWTHKMNVLLNHCDDVGINFYEIIKSAFTVLALADSDEESAELAKRSPVLSAFTGIVGSPESVSTHMGEMIDAGVDYFQLYFAIFPNKEATQLFANEVVPNL